MCLMAFQKITLSSKDKIVIFFSQQKKNAHLGELELAQFPVTARRGVHEAVSERLYQASSRGGGCNLAIWMRFGSPEPGLRGALNPP